MAVHKRSIATTQNKEKETMDFMSTVKGSLLEGFYPAGWDMKKIAALKAEGGEARPDLLHGHPRGRKLCPRRIR